MSSDHEPELPMNPPPGFEQINQPGEVLKRGPDPSEESRPLTDDQQEAWAAGELAKKLKIGGVDVDQRHKFATKEAVDSLASQLNMRIPGGMPRQTPASGSNGEVDNRVGKTANPWSLFKPHEVIPEEEI